MPVLSMLKKVLIPAMNLFYFSAQQNKGNSCEEKVGIPGIPIYAKMNEILRIICILLHLYIVKFYYLW